MIMDLNKIKDLEHQKWSSHKVWFTSDIHFFHEKISFYSKRPWLRPDGTSDLDRMTEDLINNWNETVPQDGHTFIIGDVALGGRGRTDELCRVLQRLNGTKYLIPGNHDTYILEPPCTDHYTLLPPLFSIRVKDGEGKHDIQKIVMCHFSMKIWDQAHHQAIHCFGHSHGSLPIDYSIKSMDVGIDAPGSNYRPFSYFQIKQLMKKHGNESLDHHGRDTNDKFAY